MPLASQGNAGSSETAESATFQELENSSEMEESMTSEEAEILSDAKALVMKTAEVAQAMLAMLITGCSSGIGFAAVERFSSQGWKVAATMRNPNCDAGKILSKKGNVLVLRLDVTDISSIKTAVKSTIDTFGGLDVLVNNAGYGLVGPIEFATKDQIEHQFAVNTFGPIYTLQAVLPHFRERQKGLIINVSSVLGLCPLPFMSLYQGTKFAIEGISETINMELSPLGIRVKILEPGGVKTDFFSRGVEKTGTGPPYDDMLKNWEKVMKNNAESFSNTDDILDVIWDAVTDGKDTVRYIAGTDAKAMLQMKKDLTDELFESAMIKRFGLS